MSQSPESRPPLKEGDVIRMGSEGDPEGRMVVEVTGVGEKVVVAEAGGVRLVMRVFDLSPVKQTDQGGQGAGKSSE